MGFLKRLLSGNKKDKGSGYVDKTGIYFYVQCDNCNACVRVRADKEHDLSREDGGFIWRKTVVDSRCFRPMSTTVVLNYKYELSDSEISGGKYISEAEYNAWLKQKNAPQEEEAPESEDVAEDKGAEEASSEETHDPT